MRDAYKVGVDGLEYAVECNERTNAALAEIDRIAAGVTE